jgi:hypothetical protein
VAIFDAAFANIALIMFASVLMLVIALVRARQVGVRILSGLGRSVLAIAASVDPSFCSSVAIET